MLLASCNQCFFNERVHVLGEKDETQKKAWGMVQAWERATMEALKRPTRPQFMNWLYQRRFSDLTKTMRTYAAEIIKCRKNSPELARKDMLDALLNGVDPESGEKLKDSQVLDEVLNIFIGVATTANLLSCALYYLMENPTEIKKPQMRLTPSSGVAELSLPT